MYLVRELPTAENLHARTRHFALKKVRLPLPELFIRTSPSQGPCAKLKDVPRNCVKVEFKMGPAFEGGAAW